MPKQESLGSCLTGIGCPALNEADPEEKSHMHILPTHEEIDFIVSLGVDRHSLPLSAPAKGLGSVQGLSKTKTPARHGSLSVNWVLLLILLWSIIAAIAGNWT